MQNMYQESNVTFLMSCHQVVSISCMINGIYQALFFFCLLVDLSRLLRIFYHPEISTKLGIKWAHVQGRKPLRMSRNQMKLVSIWCVSIFYLSSAKQIDEPLLIQITIHPISIRWGYCNCIILLASLSMLWLDVRKFSQTPPHQVAQVLFLQTPGILTDFLSHFLPHLPHTKINFNSIIK